MKLGFTLVEVVLVVGIILLVATAAAPLSGQWYSLNNFDSTVSMVVSSLRKAQAYAIEKNSSATWGVCLTGDVVRLFSGSCASPIVSNDYNLPSDVTVSGLSIVTFSSLRGEPSNAQSITITGNGKSKTIVINILGGYDIN